MRCRVPWRGMGGRFPHHPKGATAIDALADALEDECARLDRLAGSATEPVWDGGARESRVRRHTDRIMTHVRGLAASIQDYGDAVAAYDERVDRLNANWIAENERGFGVPPPTVDTATPPAQVAATDQAHADQVRRARADVARSLRDEYERAQAELIAAGDDFERAIARRSGEA